MVGDWHDAFRQAEQKLAVTIPQEVGPTNQPAQAQVQPQPEFIPAVPIANPPPMRPEWEKELDDKVTANNGTFEVTLLSGAKIRITPEPKASDDMMEIKVEDFKRMARAAVFMGGRIVHAMTRKQADERTKQMLDKGEGCWISPHIFIEVDKEASTPTSSQRAPDGIVAAPAQPDEYPKVDAVKWITINASILRETVPMRSENGKIIGSLLKTANGNLYARSVTDKDHRLNIVADWATGGGYTIDKSIYEKYLTDPSTVIKIARTGAMGSGVTYYFTTSTWIKKYGGVIKSWGSDRIVMPLRGKFWFVTNSIGEVIE
jgi:hypothetical protein